MPKVKRKKKKLDKWARKTLYSVISPPAFGEREVATIPADSEETLLRRVVEVPLAFFTGQLDHFPLKLRFQIYKADGTKAHTFFKGFEYSETYLRSLVQRGGKRVDAIVDVQTKDGVKTRISAMALTRYRITTGQKKAMRKLMTEYILSKVPRLKYDTLVRRIVHGKMDEELEKVARKIAPLRKACVRKIKLLSSFEEMVELLRKKEAVAG